MKEISEVDVRRAAINLLARREHSKHELSLKLRKRFSGQEDFIVEEVDKLEGEGLQSDVRLGEAFIRARSNRGQGPIRIKSELRGKGVSADAIALLFEQCEVDWFELVQIVASKKFRDEELRTIDAKGKAKLSRFLQQRGFSFEHISSLY